MAKQVYERQRKCTMVVSILYKLYMMLKIFQRKSAKESRSSQKEEVKDPLWLEEEVLHFLSLLPERWSGGV